MELQPDNNNNSNNNNYNQLNQRSSQIGNKYENDSIVLMFRSQQPSQKNYQSNQNQINQTNKKERNNEEDLFIDWQQQKPKELQNESYHLQSNLQEQSNQDYIPQEQFQIFKASITAPIILKAYHFFNKLKNIKKCSDQQINSTIIAHIKELKQHKNAIKLVTERKFKQHLEMISKLTFKAYQLTKN